MSSGLLLGLKVFFLNTYGFSGAHTCAENILVVSSCTTRWHHAGILSPSPPFHFTFILYRSPCFIALAGSFSSQLPVPSIRLSLYFSFSCQLLKSPIRYISVALGAHSTG